MGTNTKYFSVKYFLSLYSNEEMISIFRGEIKPSNTRHEDDVILEPCCGEERANMPVLDSYPIPNFYLNFYVIHDLGILIPFMPF